MDQLDLFRRAPKPRNYDEALVLRRLREAIKPPSVHGLSRRQIKLLMRPLPAITVPR